MGDGLPGPDVTSAPAASSSPHPGRPPRRSRHRVELPPVSRGVTPHGNGAVTAAAHEASSRRRKPGRLFPGDLTHDGLMAGPSGRPPGTNCRRSPRPRRRPPEFG
jgi:hypothetical protein